MENNQPIMSKYEQELQNKSETLIKELSEPSAKLETFRKALELAPWLEYTQTNKLTKAIVANDNFNKMLFDAAIHDYEIEWHGDDPMEFSKAIRSLKAAWKNKNKKPRTYK